MNIRKAIIPVAGFGTRFLPATKAQPKEMLPIIDKPIIQYIVEEAVAAGLTDIILVTSSGKQAIENHFDVTPELESHLKQQKKLEYLEQTRRISSMANFIYVRQKGPYGNGTPVLNCRHIIGREPFVVIWGDDLFMAKKPRIKQLMDVYNKYTDPVLTAYKVDDEGTNKYGIIDGRQIEKNVFQVQKIVEKPGPAKAPSHIASLGGYVLTPDIFDVLQDTKIGKAGELWLVDAIFTLSKKRPIYACLVDGKYYDVGSKLGWLQANVDFALERKDIRPDFKKYLNKI